MEPTREICDYSTSYITFVTKGRGNLARLQVESRCLLLDPEGSVTEEFFQFASCKAEDTYGEGVLFLDPNYDFSGIFSRDAYVIFRARAPKDESPYTERGLVRERFEDLLFQIRPAPEAKLLATEQEIVEATLSGVALVGRTEIRDDKTGQRALLEYPIKTMNVNDQRMIYQVDTGPLAFPDFEAFPSDNQERDEAPVNMLELAYIAFSKPGEAYFILQRQTPILDNGKEVCRVCHYSDIKRMAAKNSLMSVGVS